MNKANTLKKWEETLKLRGFAKNTIKMYLFYGEHFLEFVNKDSRKITDSDAINYLVYLKENTDWSNSTINLILSIIRYFFDVVLEKPISFRKLPNVRTEIGDPYIFTDLDLKQLILNSDTKLKAMILLGYGSGLRVSEVAKLKVKDIDSKNMLLDIEIFHDNICSILLLLFYTFSENNLLIIYAPYIATLPKERKGLKHGLLNGKFYFIIKMCIYCGDNISPLYTYTT